MYVCTEIIQISNRITGIPYMSIKVAPLYYPAEKWG